MVDIGDAPHLIPPDAIVDTDVAILLRDGFVGSDGRTYEEVLSGFRNPVLTFLTLGEIRLLQHLEERQADRQAWDVHLEPFMTIYATSEICTYWGRLVAGDAQYTPLLANWYTWQATMCLFLGIPLITDSPATYSQYRELGLRIETLRWENDGS